MVGARLAACVAVAAPAVIRRARVVRLGLQIKLFHRTPLRTCAA
jgi:hypothetical protein